MTIDEVTLDKMLKGLDPNNPQSFTDVGLFGQLKKVLAEIMLQAELTHHLKQQRNALEAVRSRRTMSGGQEVTALSMRQPLYLPRNDLLYITNQYIYSGASGSALPACSS